LNALSNLTYILPRYTNQSELEKWALFWLDFFELEPNKYPQAMSGGMRRRLALARTMAANRSLLILDEPFAFLDRRWHERIASQVILTVNKGAAVVLAGHSVPEFLTTTIPDRLDLAEVTSQPIRLNNL
jgi:ABC-type nitrate/sulfonate/bicarbonate transport system ATPase subunit